MIWRSGKAFMAVLGARRPLDVFNKCGSFNLASISVNMFHATTDWIPIQNRSTTVDHLMYRIRMGSRSNHTTSNLAAMKISSKSRFFATNLQVNKILKLKGLGFSAYCGNTAGPMHLSVS